VKRIAIGQRYGRESRISRLLGPHLIDKAILKRLF
jgi:hypothetical protein